MPVFAGKGQLWHRCKMSLKKTFFILVCLGATSPVFASEETAAVESVWSNFSAGYAAGDARLLSELWDANGDFVTLSGGLLNGRKEIAAFFEESLQGAFKGSQMHLSTDKLRRLTPDLLLVDGSWVVTGDNIPQKYPHSGVFTQVLQRSNGQWRILVARFSVPLAGHTNGRGRSQ